ncbi:MAG TPA: zf-HC2 domain-containing protein [Pirellulales bacterium]|nr:zf-HC2 domain-containing protein [Pirellulales bacterium]
MNPIPDDPIPDDPIPDDDAVRGDGAIREEELLSAYLDGELPADERGRVERLLAEQPESRQWLDELRSLRSTLEGVPRYRLENDFAERVLRAAERTMLSGEVAFSGEAALSAKVEGDASEANGRSREAGKPAPGSLSGGVWSSPGAGWSWRRARRPLVCAGLSLAAGLLIMLTQGHWPAGPHGGRRPAGPRAGQRGGNRPAGPHGREVAVAPRNAEIGAATRHDKPLQESSERDRVELSLESMDGKPTNGNADRPLGNAARRGRQSNKAPPPTSSLGSPPPATASQPTGLGRLADGEDSDKRLAEVAAADDTLLVVCDVASNLVDRPEFQQLLAKHHILLEPASVELLRRFKELTPPSRGEDLALSKSEKKISAEDGTAENDGDLMFYRLRRRQRDVDAARGENRKAAVDALDDALDGIPDGGEVEGVLVEATEEQLEAVVADFERHSELFLSLAVDPAPDVPEQQGLTACNRTRTIVKPPAGPASAAKPDSPAQQAPPAPAEAPKGAALKDDVDDTSEPKDRAAATPADDREPAKGAVPRSEVHGRAMRLSTRASDKFKLREEPREDEDVKRESARKAGAKPVDALNAEASRDKKKVAEGGGQFGAARQAQRRAILIFRCVAPDGG